MTSSTLVMRSNFFRMDYAHQTLRKIPLFHLVFCCGKCAFPRNFHTRKLGEITVFYAVKFWQHQQQAPIKFGLN